MTANKKRARRRAKPSGALSRAGTLLRRTFYYLRGEQLINVYCRLTCEAAWGRPEEGIQ